MRLGRPIRRRAGNSRRRGGSPRQNRQLCESGEEKKQETPRSAKSAHPLLNEAASAAGQPPVSRRSAAGLPPISRLAPTIATPGRAARQLMGVSGLPVTCSTTEATTETEKNLKKMIDVGGVLAYLSRVATNNQAARLSIPLVFGFSLGSISRAAFFLRLSSGGGGARNSVRLTPACSTRSRSAVSKRKRGSLPQTAA